MIKYQDNKFYQTVAAGVLNFCRNPSNMLLNSLGTSIMGA